MLINGSNGSPDHPDWMASGALDACTECARETGHSVVVSFLGPGGTRMYASDSIAERLGEIQQVLGEGPSIDVTTSRAPILLSRLDDPSMGLTTWWPVFLKAAQELGVAAVFAFPIHVGAVMLGSLTVVAADPGDLSDETLSVVLRAADRIGMSLVQSIRTDDVLVAESWSMVSHQAAGMVSAQLDSSISEALARIRAVAFVEDKSIHQLATEIVGGGSSGCFGARRPAGQVLRCPGGHAGRRLRRR